MLLRYYGGFACGMKVHNHRDKDRDRDRNIELIRSVKAYIQPVNRTPQ